MKFTLVPDYKFDNYSCATDEFLLSIGVRGIILDIDNTLEPYENPMPTDGVIAWLSSLKNAGISVAFVSNNNKERVKTFNSRFNLPAFPKAGKPFPKNLKKAMSIMGTDKSNTIIMGDQILTDVLAGRFAGIRTILVPPIKDKTDWFTRFKRWLEKPIIRKYNKKKRIDNKKEDKQ